MRYTLRSPTEADHEFIYNVKKEAYRKYVEMYFGGWDEVRQRELFASFIDTYKDGTKIITLDGADIGFFNGEYTADGYELGNICIVPEYRGRGIGTAVLRNIIADNSGKRISLRFFKTNPAGKLYERLKFRIVGETSVHYLMEREEVAE